MSNLLPGENLVLKAHPHWIVLVKSVWIPIVLVVLVVIADFVAGRIGCAPDDLIPQTVAHAALGTSMAAFLVWVDDPSSDLVENLEEAYRLLGHGLRRLDLDQPASAGR